MSISVTTIFYGVRIRSWQLIVAAHAFIRFAPLLKSLDIIILRRRNGTLQIGATSSGVRNIGDMPVEVLEMIRGQVFSKKELKRVANSLLFEGTGNWKKIAVLWSGTTFTLYGRWTRTFDRRQIHFSHRSPLLAYPIRHRSGPQS